MPREAPVLGTWSAGICSTGKLNREIGDAIDFLLSPPLAVIRKLEGSQAFSNSNWNRRFGFLMEWDTVEVDTDSGWDSQNHRYVAQVAGCYELILQVQLIAEQGSGVFTGRSFTMAKNNATEFGAGWWLRPTQSSYSQSKVMTSMVQLNVGDYLEVQCTARNGDSAIVGYDGTTLFGCEWVIRWISKL